MKRNDCVGKQFALILKKVSIAAWILKLVPIPVGIITAKLMADTVSFATSGDVSNVIVTAVYLLAVLVGLRIFTIVTSIAYEKSASQSLHQCKMILYEKLLSSPLHVLYSYGHGETIEKLNDDFETVTGINLSLYPNFGTGIVTAGVYFIFLAIQSPMIALSLLCISLLQIIPPVIVKKYMKKNYERTREIEAKLTDYIVAGYQGLATIKLYNLKGWHLDRLKNLHKEYTKIGNASEITGASEAAMDSLLDNILKYGTYGIIGAMILWQLADMNTGVEAIALSGSFFAAVKTIFDSIPQFTVARTADKRIGQWFEFDYPREKFNDEYYIALNDVACSYDQKSVLTHASANISFDRITVIKGANGIGKSTLFKLMVGLVKCESGSVSIAGADPLRLSDLELNSNVFYLPQNDISFSLSAEELFYMMCGNSKNALMDRCIQNAARFGLTNKILRDSLISELSGGERKKVFLSAAFALDKPILLLDEPTNSLDAHGKKILYEMLRERKSGAVIITHDADLQGIADDVYSIREGGIFHEQTEKTDTCRLRQDNEYTSDI